MSPEAVYLSVALAWGAAVAARQPRVFYRGPARYRSWAVAGRVLGSAAAGACWPAWVALWVWRQARRALR